MGDPVTLTAMTVASMGLSAAGQGLTAEGKATADQYKAEQLDESAKYGELKAQQTNAQMTRNLTMTLGNIDAVRAASRTDPTSPSGVAVRDFVEQTGNEQKGITVSNIEQQARMDESNAAYLRSASDDALLGGELGIFGTLLKGASGLPGLKSGGGASS